MASLYLYLSRVHRPSASTSDSALVRPGVPAFEGKVIRVGDGLPLRRGRLEHLVCDAMPLAIGHRLLLGVEPQPQLLPHVTG